MTSSSQKTSAQMGRPSRKHYGGYCTPIDGKYVKIFLLHDWLYFSKEVSRKTADELMKKLLIEAGMRKMKAYSIYYAVRAFGGSHWK